MTGSANSSCKTESVSKPASKNDMQTNLQLHLSEFEKYKLLLYIRNYMYYNHSILIVKLIAHL